MAMSQIPHNPVFCLINVIFCRSRVFIFSLCYIQFFSLCNVQILACVLCSSRATARPVAAGGRFAPAGLASLASLATKLGVVHVLGKETN